MFFCGMGTIKIPEGLWRGWVGAWEQREFRGWVGPLSSTTVGWVGPQYSMITSLYLSAVYIQYWILRLIEILIRDHRRNRQIIRDFVSLLS